MHSTFHLQTAHNPTMQHSHCYYSRMDHPHLPEATPIKTDTVVQLPWVL